MQVVALPAAQLSSAQRDDWAALVRNERAFDSPYFHPRFTLAVAEVRPQVEVAVLEGSTGAGYWPFERGASGAACPAAGPLADFQGPVLPGDTRIDPAAILQACGLKSWRFDHLVSSGDAFAPYTWATAESPLIDLTGGFDSYVAQRRQAAAGDVLQAMSKRKRAEKQLGPLRFELCSGDRAVLDRVIEWKSAQYRRTGVRSVFDEPWTRALLRRLLDEPDPAEFGGVLSALYFGDRLAAAHFGMRAGGVLHWWYPAYDVELAKYSPGSQLLLETARAAESQGVARIDLGKGPEAYKRDFSNGAIALGEGCVGARPGAATMRRLWRGTKRLVKQSPLRRPAQVPWRMIRRMRDQMLAR